MPVQHYDTDAQNEDRQPTQNDQPADVSPVPPVLRQLFERSASERSGPRPLDIFPPADWPSCPACGDRLLAAAVATDAHDALVAAAMRCSNSAHESRQYVFNVVTDTLYVDQGCAAPATEPPGG